MAGTLHLTWQSAADQIAYACTVAGLLPNTFAALAAGLIHPVHVRIIEDETRFLSDAAAAAADEELARAAASKTFGELRYAAHRLVLKLDPDSGPGSGGPGPQGNGPPGSGPSGSARPARRDNGPSLAALVTITAPLAALTGDTGPPGEVAGFGLVDPQSLRDLVTAASRNPDTRWCLTALHPDGIAAAHGCAVGSHPWTPGTRSSRGRGSFRYTGPLRHCRP